MMLLVWSSKKDKTIIFYKRRGDKRDLSFDCRREKDFTLGA
jgi:hypothetical protein